MDTDLLKEQLINLQFKVQIEDQQKEIVKLRKTIDLLRKKNLQDKRELIKKNVESLVHCEGLSDYIINSLVDYILEREK